MHSISHSTNIKGPVNQNQSLGLFDFNYTSLDLGYTSPLLTAHFATFIAQTGLTIHKIVGREAEGFDLALREASMAHSAGPQGVNRAHLQKPKALTLQSTSSTCRTHPSLFMAVHVIYSNYVAMGAVAHLQLSPKMHLFWTSHRGCSVPMSLHSPPSAHMATPTLAITGPPAR